jgi:hypothetical protein
MNDSTAEVGIEEETAVIEEASTETAEAEVDDSEEYVDDDDGGDFEDDEELPEYREYNFGGKEFKVPKNALDDAQSEEFEAYGKGLQSDYTRKTQELSEARKTIEAREKSAEKLLSLQGDTLDIYSKGLAIRQELQQLNQIDLQSLWQSNPDQARQISDTLSQKQAEFDSTVNQVSQKEAEMAHAQQAQLHSRAEQGEKTLNARIPDFSKKVGSVIDYVAKEYGINKKEAEAAWRGDPLTSELAYKAMLYDNMKAKVKKGSKVAPTTATEATPVKGRGGRSKSNVPSDKDSTKVWLAKREAQIRKRQG